MNRYRLEVAEMDRRHARTMRALYFVGAAAVAVSVLWAAGLPPTQWWQTVHGWLAVASGSSLPDKSVTGSQLPAASDPAIVTPSTRASIPLVQDAVDSSVPRPLHLLSTAPGRNANEGTAQLGTDLEHPQTYVAGAILANGARLAEIHADHVVLRRSGAELKIYLFADGSVAKRAGGDAALAVVGGGPPTPSPKPPSLATDALTEVIRSMAFYENDLFSGLQVFPGKHSAAFSQLGLRSGDVIVALEGAPLVDARDATEMLRPLLDGARIAVTVRRDRQASSISLDGTIVAKAVAPAQIDGPRHAMATP